MKTYINTKLMMYLIIITSTIMAISSTNMVMIWLSLELNLFSFILLLMNKSMMNEVEASIDYLLSQALGSMLFLMTSISMLYLHWLMKLNSTLMTLAIIMKLGMVPCHYWFLSVMEKISWMNCFILSTWQKLAPLFILLFIIKPSSKSSSVLACLNALCGSLLGLSQPILKKIMACSSIAHMGWVMGGLMMKAPYLSTIYFFMYVLISTPLFIVLKKLDNNLLYESWLKQKFLYKFKLLLTLLLLSLAGLPPLTGFMPKLLMMSMLLNHSTMTITVLIISSLLSLSFYLNISLNFLMSSQMSSKSSPMTMPPYSINMMMSTSMLGSLLMII